jgi:predicted Zn finger-like uncharacterized protein
MDVRCERCRAQYVFDDEQVTPAGLTVQCTNCGHVFKVKKKELVVTVPVKPDELEGVPLPATAAAPKSAGSGAAAPGGAAGHEPERPRDPAREPPREWRVRQANGNIFTFRELTTLQKWIIEQKVSRDDEISLSGDQWKRLGNIAELASFFQVVEAAERGKAGPAVTPVPMSLPVYGLTLQAPPAYPPPAYPGPPYGTTPSAPLPIPEYRQEPLPAAPAPVPTVEVDLGPEELSSVKKGRVGRFALAVLVFLVAGGGAAWFLAPELFAPLLPPKPAGDAAAVAVPITIEVKPSAPEPSPPPAPTPVAAPEPVVERAVEPPPEPIGGKAPAPVAKAPALPKGPKALLAEAERLREAGKVDRALDLYGRVVEEDPSNVEALTGRALCYFDLGRYPPAEASFQAALGLAPDEPDALLGLAETYRWQGKTEDAIRYYEKYLAKHPGGEEAGVARHALEELRK